MKFQLLSSLDMSNTCDSNLCDVFAYLELEDLHGGVLMALGGARSGTQRVADHDCAARLRFLGAILSLSLAVFLRCDPQRVEEPVIIQLARAR